MKINPFFIFYNYYSKFPLIIDTNKFCFSLINKKPSNKHIVNKTTLQKLLPAILVIVAGIIVISIAEHEQKAFAEVDSTPTILVSEKLKNNPLAMKIIAEMEAQKIRYKQGTEQKIIDIPLTDEQIEIEETRKIVEDRLKEDLDSMEKKYLDFTPRNAFKKFVEKLNETYHGIFWDQFDYLNAKVQLAIAAKNLVLENGGSFYDAQREYFKYASMPRVDMINYIEELNIKYGFADEDIQSYFDEDGKLPRFEDDNDAPCYGCENLQSVDDSKSKDENKITKISHVEEKDEKSELKILSERLSNLRQEFLAETNHKKKKSIVDSLNDTVKKIQNLKY